MSFLGLLPQRMDCGFVKDVPVSYLGLFPKTVDCGFVKDVPVSCLDHLPNCVTEWYDRKLAGQKMQSPNCGFAVVATGVDIKNCQRNNEGGSGCIQN